MEFKRLVTNQKNGLLKTERLVEAHGKHQSKRRLGIKRRTAQGNLWAQGRWETGSAKLSHVSKNLRVPGEAVKLHKTVGGGGR